MEKSLPELLDLAIVSAKHWRMIIVKTDCCKVNSDDSFNYHYKSVTP